MSKTGYADLPMATALDYGYSAPVYAASAGLGDAAPSAPLYPAGERVPPEDYAAIIERGEVDAEGARRFLREHQWPEGLQSFFVRGVARTSIRFMIFDDSGSMAAEDGQLLVSGSRPVRCTRWREQAAGVEFHVGLANAARAPTEIRFLNAGVPIMLGAGLGGDGEGAVRAVLASGQSGGTPLCRHIAEVAHKIRSLERLLLSRGEIAVVVICTVGLEQGYPSALRLHRTARRLTATWRRR